MSQQMKFKKFFGWRTEHFRLFSSSLRVDVVIQLTTLFPFIYGAQSFSVRRYDIRGAPLPLIAQFTDKSEREREIACKMEQWTQIKLIENN